MLIEAFSQAKRPGEPERNEDALVVIPGRAYAVIDGATDRSGRRYEGATSGQLAARAVASALHALFGAIEPARFDTATTLTAATSAIAGEYCRLGIGDLARRDRNNRFNATLALAVPQGPTLHLLLVGDSGIRVNGRDLHQQNKLLDTITASLRVAAFARLRASGVAEERIDALAAHVTFHGTRHGAANGLTEEDLAAIEADVLARHRGAHPEIPAPVLESLVAGGILFGQSPHQNNAASPLGYSCLDGFPIPACLIRTAALPLAGVHEIELFTDGYFAPGETVGLAAWEAAFARVEALDPHKIGAFPSVKGSVAGAFADDRTYLRVSP